MDAGTDARSAPRSYAALAGLQAGMVGVLLMLLWLAAASVWYRHTPWSVPNIMASNFYGDDAIGPGFSWRSLSGVAVYLILYSLFGALFGAVMHGSAFSRFRLVLLGILAGAAWYYLWFGLLWKHIEPLVWLYTHNRPMLWGHLLYGAMLGRYTIYEGRLTGPPPAPPAAMPAEPAPAAAADTEPTPAEGPAKASD
jgi:hypothetical protein